MILQSPYLQPSQHGFTTPKGLEDWLKTQYKRFVEVIPRTLPQPPPNAEALKERRLFLLRGFGRELYQKVAPPALKEAFWHLHDKLGERFQTIQIYTSNPIIPWELLRPSRKRSLGTEERDFLGVEFRIARWHISQGLTQLEQAPHSMLLKELVVIVPRYEGEMSLPSLAKEIQVLEGIIGYRQVPGQLAPVRSLFAAAPAGVVHFSGHGMVYEKEKGIFEYAIRLEDIELDLLTWQGLMPLPPRGHPFVFFNACDIGQTHRVANFVTGWAPAVLEGGASGYVGGLWPLGDNGATTFATHFYTNLQRGLTKGPVVVADILRDSRRLFYTEGDPTFLAYVYYGNPNFQFMPVGLHR